MARPVRSMSIQFKVEYVPVPKDRIGSWRASLLLLLDLLREEKSLYEAEVRNDAVSFIRDDHRIGTALFPLANVVARKEAAKARGIHAWVIGHDGSVHRMALADWRV